MLVELAIRDIVLIERLEVGFGAGLTVLTGETGAGKSILLDALGLALGGRGDAGLVRHGAAQGQVSAVFDPGPDHPARALLAENGVEAEGEVILRRVQSADGRTRGFVNDEPASAGLMQRLGALLVEIHGQHDARALVDPAAHRALLDAFGGHRPAVAAVAEAWKARREAETALERHLARIAAAAREGEFLRASLEELDALAPEVGEEAALAETRAAMMRVEKVAGDLSDAFEQLNGTGSPVPEVASLMRRLERKRTEAPELVTAPVEALGRALDALEEARFGLEHALAATAFDPKVLERTEERLFALRAAARKHHVPVDELAALRARMTADLADIDAGEERTAALERAVEAARSTYAAAAGTLTTARRKAAAALAGAVERELPALKLERARFEAVVTTDPDEPGPAGIDAVEFHVQTNPGTRAGPLAKIASGGELSRFLLALKVALADRGSAPTLIFDEIDTGVGGAVAEAIGTRLARLSERVQVLAVTHAPQVAARAAGHLLIAKEAVGAEAVATRVDPLAGETRREEIARMLAGAVITDEARAAADRLMAGVG
jgi:DNA repair protein RecN (Recombination protein N)